MAKDILDKILRIKIIGKSPVGGFLRVNRWVWDRLPASATNLRVVRSYGNFLHALVCRWSDRTQFFGTFFMRNRPQLDLICRLSNQTESATTLTMTVLGCSNGAEVYSILATLRSARPELKVVLHAVDISQEILSLAQKGTYSISSPGLVREFIFQRLTEDEIQKMFDRCGDEVSIQPWIKEGIFWQLGDVRDPEILDRLGPQDIVVANNFHCHMKPPEAMACLRGIARLVKPGGYLVVSGIDLDVRKKIATEQKWKPVTELLEGIHDGDIALRRDWPWSYWGLEPLDKHRKDWIYRYAAVFQIGERSRPENFHSLACNGQGGESKTSSMPLTVGQ
jgi:chemotaxis methyl-accepting protein methylase